MPAMVGGFGNLNNSFKFKPVMLNHPLFGKRALSYNESPISNPSSLINKDNSKLAAYLAGLIEGDGTIAVHETNSTAKKYSPSIIIVFKKSDLPLANYLQEVTKCGKVYIKPERGYVLWQIQELVGVFTIISLINGYMRTPKNEALARAINWFNAYIKANQNSKLPSTQANLSKINLIEVKSLDESPITSNSWLSGFTDADGNFSINIHQRSNKNLTRVQLYFRLENRQTYHRTDTELFKTSYFPLMSKIASYLGVSVYSRSRSVKEKEFYSFTVMSSTKSSLSKTTEYFNQFPLLSSKYLDYIKWNSILELQNANSLTSTYLDAAIMARKDFNKTRTTYNWDHLKDCYLLT
jgi:hypothetical protein